jgi:hypothetical protein
MISIVDADELKNVLRPTVYVAAVDAFHSGISSGSAPSERIHGWSDTSSHDREPGTQTLAVESVSSSQHSG